MPIKIGTDSLSDMLIMEWLWRIFILKNFSSLYLLHTVSSKWKSWKILLNITRAGIIWFSKIKKKSLIKKNITLHLNSFSFYIIPKEAQHFNISTICHNCENRYMGQALGNRRMMMWLRPPWIIEKNTKPAQKVSMCGEIILTQHDERFDFHRMISTTHNSCRSPFPVSPNNEKVGSLVPNDFQLQIHKRTSISSGP